MQALKLSEDLLPLSEMKSQASEVVDRVTRTRRPVVLTRYGRGVAVVLSIEAFEDLQLEAAKQRLFAGLQEAETAISQGQVVGEAEMDGLLSRWADED